MSRTFWEVSESFQLCVISKISGTVGEEDRNSDQKEEERNEDETPMMRTGEVSCLSNQIRCDEQADARAGGDDTESQPHIFLP